MTLYMPSCARSGATPLKSTQSVSRWRARCTSMVPEPASVLMKGSTTVMAKAVATAASTALPPASRISAPTRAPWRCSAAVMPRRASGVSLVTRTRERIMAPPGKRSAVGWNVLRDVDDPVALEEEGPAEGIDEHLGSLAANGRPVDARDVLHLGGVGARTQRLAEQDLHLLFVHAHHHLLV